MLNRRLHRIIIGGITGIVLFSLIGAWLLISRTSLFCFCLYLYDHSFGYYADKENGQDKPPAGKLLQRNQ